MERRRPVTGVVLVVLGVLLLAAQWLRIGAEGTVALVGVALLTAYALTGQYGFLVPGAILTGLGVGIVVEQRTQAGGAAVLLGLGLGFVGITAVSRLRGRMPADWWPLIPGGILTALGLLLAAGQTGWLQALGRWWPVVLIALGLYIIVRSRTPPGR